MRKTIIIAALVATITAIGSAEAARLITGKQIKNNSLTGTDIRDESIRSRDLAGGIISDEELAAGIASKIDRGLTEPAAPPAPALSRAQAVTASATMVPDQVGSVAAFCPAGQNAVAGDWFAGITRAGAVGFSDDRTSYFLIVHNDSSISAEIDATAWCVPTGHAVAARRDRSGAVREIERIEARLRAALNE